MKKGKNNSAKKESVNLKTTPNADRVNAILAADPEYQKISERYDQLRQILAKLWADIQANDSPTNPAISQYTRTRKRDQGPAGQQPANGLYKQLLALLNKGENSHEGITNNAPGRG